MVVPRCVNAEPAPSASDFQNLIGGGKVEFPAEQVVFPDLRGFEGGLGRIEISARVGHRRIEPEFEEFVTEVVVLADVLQTGLEAVRAASMDGAVDDVQNVEDPGASCAVGLQRVGLGGVQDEPRNDFGDVRRFPLGRQKTLRKTDRAEKHAAPEEGRLDNPHLRVNAGINTAEFLLCAVGQRERKRTVFEFGETLENQAAEDHIKLRDPEAPCRRAVPLRLPRQLPRRGKAEIFRAEA